MDQAEGAGCVANAPGQMAQEARKSADLVEICRRIIEDGDLLVINIAHRYDEKTRIPVQAAASPPDIRLRPRDRGAVCAAWDRDSRGGEGR